MKKGILRKLIAVVAVATIAISAVGCGSSNSGDTAGAGDAKVEATGDETSLEGIKSKGKLVVGTSADFPPYEFHKEIDGKDEIVGFDIDIAKEVAKDLGVELEIKDMDFDGLLVALQAGKVDMVFAGMSPTEERKQNADFTDVYYQGNHTFIMRAGEEAGMNAMEDLKGKKIGVQKGSIQEEMAKEAYGEENLKSLAKVTDLVLDLKNNKVDAILVETAVAEFNVEKNEGLALTGFTVEDETGGSAIALKKGSDEVVAEVNKTIQKLKDEKKIDEFVVNANEMMD